MGGSGAAGGGGERAVVMARLPTCDVDEVIGRNAPCVPSVLESRENVTFVQLSEGVSAGVTLWVVVLNIRRCQGSSRKG